MNCTRSVSRFPTPHREGRDPTMSEPLSPAPSEPFKPASTHHYLNATQVARLLQCDVTTVYRLASSDVSMPALRLGGLVRFHRERLLAWLEAHEQGRSRGRRRLTASESGGRAA